MASLTALVVRGSAAVNPDAEVLATLPALAVAWHDSYDMPSLQQALQQRALRSSTCSWGTSHPPDFGRSTTAHFCLDPPDCLLALPL